MVNVRISRVCRPRTKCSCQERSSIISFFVPITLTTMVPAIIGNLLNRTRKNKNIELRKPQNDYEVKIRRRRAILTFIARRLVALRSVVTTFPPNIFLNLKVIRFILILVGYIWMLVLPAPRLSRRTWVDENALQPGRVCVT